MGSGGFGVSSVSRLDDGESFTVGDDNAVLALNGFIRHSFCQINREQDRVHLESPEQPVSTS